MDAQSQALKELAGAANNASDTIQELEDKVKRLSGQAEGPSRRERSFVKTHMYCIIWADRPHGS